MTEGNGKDHTLIDIRDVRGIAMQTWGENRHEDELLESMIGRKLSQLPPPTVPSCIFRIPSRLRRHADEENFVPSIVSIGPLHHGEDNLQAMEEVKLLYLQGLLDRKPTPETSLHNFVKEIRNIEQDCRNCYDEKFHHFSSEKFVAMMVVDGCFVIELLRKVSGEVLKPKGDPVFSNSWMHFATKTDLLLLENQLPWRVLDCLFDLTSEDGKLPLPELIIECFKGCTLRWSNLHANTEALSKMHLLDFLGNCLYGSSDESEIENYSHRLSIPCVTELAKLGVRIMCGSDHNMCNVTFDRPTAVLRIPPIRGLENGESLLRNLRAYAQLEPSNKSKPISYFVLLDDLIMCDEDLQLLSSRGIIQNHYDDAIRWFAKDRFNTTVGLINNFSYSDLYYNLNLIGRRPWNVWLWTVRSMYFKNPWDMINLIVIIFLVTTFTGLQTLYSILSYYK